MTGAAGPEPVLFLESRLHHGGDVQVLLDMLAALDPALFQAHVACVPGGAVTAQSSNLPPEVRLHPMAFGYGDSGPARVQSLVSTVRALRRLVHAEGIRVVHSNNTRRTLTAGVLLKAVAPRQVRLIYHAHCEPQHTAAHRAALRLSTQVWCVSEFVRSEYRRLGVPDRKLVMMPNGAQFHAVAGGAAVREQWGVPDDAPLVVLVGRLSPVKGQHLAVAALGQPSVPAGTVLALVGDDSIEDRNEGYREHLLEIARELGVEDRLVLAGFRPDPGPCYAAADVIVIPSHREPFGLVALEAAAAGRPIVATRSGGLIEVLGDVAGLPLVGEDPEALAEGVALALAGRQEPPPSVVRDRLAARYSMTAFARRLNEALQDLAGRAPRAKVRPGAG